MTIEMMMTMVVHFIENSLWSTMEQDCLSNLMVLVCRQDLAKTLNYDDIITSFATTKAQKELHLNKKNLCIITEILTVIKTSFQN